MVTEASLPPRIDRARAAWGLLIVTLLASLTACDPIYTLRVRIEVPPGALEPGGSLPQGVFVSLDAPFADATVPRSLTAVICEPLLEPARIRSKITGVGSHGHRGNVWAWVQPLPEAVINEPCGPRPNFVAVEDFPALVGAWRDTAVMFQHEDGEDTVELVLAPP